MKSALPAFILPCLVLVASLVVLAQWPRMIDLNDVRLRLPGADRPAATAAPADRPLVGTLLVGSGRAVSLPGDWPRFRGERFDGIAHKSVSLARSWPPAGPKMLWAVELGEGYAGAAVRHGRVYILDYDREAQADVLRCLALADGRQIWQFSYPVAIKRNHGMSRTIPAVSEKYVFTLGPKCHVMSLDARSGHCFWLKDLVAEFGAAVPQWYAGQCPLIDGDLAVFAPGGGDSLLVAMHCETGAVAWRTPNPRGWAMTHSSIMPMEFAGRKMYVYCGKGGAIGVSADDGSLLWDTTAWKISIATCPSPVILPEGRIFCCGGYNSGSVMLQLEEEEDGKLVAREAFRLHPKQFGSTQQTPIFFEDHLFGVREADEQLVCLDLSGREVWSSGAKSRFGSGPYLVADGLLLVLDDDGSLTLAEATSDGFKPLARARVLDGHDAWAPMALAAGRLLARDFTRMVCLDVAASLPGAENGDARTEEPSQPSSSRDRRNPSRDREGAGAAGPMTPPRSLTVAARIPQGRGSADSPTSPKEQ